MQNNGSASEMSPTSTKKYFAEDWHPAVRIFGILSLIVYAAHNLLKFLFFRDDYFVSTALDGLFACGCFYIAFYHVRGSKFLPNVGLALIVTVLALAIVTTILGWNFIDWYRAGAPIFSH